MKSAEQIKGAAKNIAKKMNLKPQEVLQIFMFERLVERLSISKYKENFILKGGLLIASMIGIAERTTMDGHNYSRSSYDGGGDGKNNKRNSCY